MNQSGYQDLLCNSMINSDSMVVSIINLPNLDANSVAYIDSNNDLSDIFLTDGQLVIGDTGDAPVAASLTGTTNQVNITNGPGSITLSLPQDIATTSSPTFNNITSTSLNGTLVSNYIITPSSIDLDTNTHDISNVTNLNSLAVTRSQILDLEQQEIFLYLSRVKLFKIVVFLRLQLAVALFYR